LHPATRKGATKESIDKVQEFIKLKGSYFIGFNMKKGEGVASSYQRQLEALNQLSQAILSNVDLEKIEKLLVKEIQAIFGGVGCILFSPDGRGHLVAKAFSRVPGQDLEKLKTKIEDGLAGKVWKTRRPSYSNDIVGDRVFRGRPHPMALRLNVTKLLSVPLLLNGEPIGVLSVARTPQHADFTDLDEELLGGFSNQAAIAIKNASTHQALKREQEALKKGNRELLEKEKDLRQSNLESKLLSDISNIVNSSLGFDEVLSRIMRETCKLLGYQAAAMFFYNSREKTLLMVSSYKGTMPGTRNVKELSFHLDEALGGQSFKSGEIISFHKAGPKEKNRIHNIFYELKLKSAAYIPLVAKEKKIGLLALVSRQEVRLDPLLERLASAIGNQVGIAIENASVHQAVQRKQEALQESEEKYRRVFEDSPMGLYRTTPEGRILMANPALLKMLGYSSLEELSQRNLEDSGYEPGYPRSGFKKRIESKGEVVGLESAWIRVDGSTLHVRENARAIRDDDGNTLYYEGTVEDITVQKLLNEISTIVNSSLDLNTVLSSIMRESCKALGFQMAAVYLHNPNERGLELRSTYNTPQATAEKLKEVTFQVQQSLTGQCFKSSKVISYDKLSTAQRQRVHELFYHQRLKALTCIPVTAKDKRIGVLSLVSRKEVKLDPILERMASAIGNEVGIAIENASVHEALKQERQALQQSNLESKLLNKISSIVNSSLDLDKVLKRIMRETCKALGFQAANMYFYNPKERVLEVRSSHNVPNSFARKIQEAPLDIDRSLAGRSFKSGKVISYQKLSPQGRKQVHRLFHILGVKAFIHIPVTAAGGRIGVLTLASQKEVNLGPLQERLASSIGQQVGVAIENARLHESTSRQAEKLARWNKRLTTFLGVSQAAVESVHLNSFLDEITRLVAESFQADRCSIVLLDDTGTLGVVRGLYPKGKGHFPQLGTKMKLADFPHMSMTCLGGRVGKFNLRDFKDASDSEHKHILRTRMRSAMVVTLGFEKENLGALSVWSAEDNREYSQEEIDFLAAIANQVATAIRKFELAQEVKEKKENLERLSSEMMQLQEKERKAVAAELHDSIGQSLTAMRINLDFAESFMPPEQKELKSRIQQISKLVAATMEEIRSIGQALRPTMLDDLGLIPTLRWFTKDFSRQLSIPVHFSSRGDPKRLTPEVKITIYRIIQEGLNNIAKHSKATQASVSLQVEDRACCLEIKDNGIGIEAEKVLKSTDARRGFGVFNIRERASLLGGKLEIQSDKGKGTTLSVTIPVLKGEPDEQSQSSIGR
jgi:PAS domain S-box-containing protein